MGINASRVIVVNYIAKADRSRVKFLSTMTEMNHDVFKGVKDNYNGIVIKSCQEPHDRSTMEKLLQGFFSHVQNIR